MPLLLDTAELPARERTDALQTALTAATAAHDICLLGPPDKVHARLERWPLSNDVAVIRQVSSGIRHTRTDRHMGRDGPEWVVFVLHDGPDGSYTHGGGTYPLHRGGLSVTHLNSRYSYTRPGEGSANIVQVERSALDVTVEQVQSATVRLCTSPFYDLLRSHIADLSKAAPALGCAVSASLAPLTAHLAGTLLRTTDSENALLPVDSPNAYLIERTVSFMRRNFGRPELSPDEIARIHRVSPRYLFRQWETQPRSLAETLLDIRLSAARQLLSEQPCMPVAVIAHRCGFVNPSHFGRRFRSVYGVSPRQYRDASTPKAGTEPRHTAGRRKPPGTSG